jgi:large subunit ribosomal protein L11e
MALYEHALAHFQSTKRLSIMQAEEKKQNPMKELRIRKLCLNICVGESGDRLTRAAKV